MAASDRRLASNDVVLIHTMVGNCGPIPQVQDIKSGNARDTMSPLHFRSFVACSQYNLRERGTDQDLCPYQPAHRLWLDAITLLSFLHHIIFFLCHLSLLCDLKLAPTWLETVERV